MMRWLLVWWWRRGLRKARHTLTLLDRMDAAKVDFKGQYHVALNPVYVRTCAMARQLQAIQRLEELDDTKTDLTQISTGESRFSALV